MFVGRRFGSHALLVGLAASASCASNEHDAGSTTANTSATATTGVTSGTGAGGSATATSGGTDPSTTASTGGTGGAPPLPCLPGGPCSHVVWAKTAGGSSGQYASAVAIDVVGDVVVGGSFSGTLDFGGTELDAGTPTRAFVAKLAGGTGDELWSRSFGDDSGASNCTGMAADASGAVLVTGTTTQPIDFGGGLRCGTDHRQTFLVKLDAAGEHLFSECFGEGWTTTSASVAVDADGNVVLAGSSYDDVDFGLGAPVGPGAFVAKFDSNGGALWARGFGELADTGVYGVATGPAGDVIVGGWFSGELDVGADSLASPDGTHEGFVLVLDANGTPLWARGFAGAGDQPSSIASVAADPLGGFIATGDAFARIDGGASSALVNGTLASFGANGDVSWTSGLGAYAPGAAVAGDDAGDAIVLDRAMPIGSTGYGQIVLTGFDPSGALIYPSDLARVKSFGPGAGNAVAVRGGRVAIAGAASGVDDFGAGPLPMPQGLDVFVAVFDL